MSFSDPVKAGFALLLILPCLVLLAACNKGPAAAGGQARAAEDSTGPRAAQAITLPAPRLEGDVSVEAAIVGRRSVRQFADEALKLAEVAQLLWAAQGITYPERGFRTAPSAGALFPLEAYVVAGDVDGLDPGIYRYRPADHSITLVRSGDQRAALYDATYQQSAVRDAPALICFAAVYERTSVKYGNKAERFVHMEIGHAGQNVCLQAIALGLKSVTIGGFDDALVKSALAVPGEERALYLIPVGRG